MSNANWWANKLGAPQQPQRQQQTHYVPPPGYVPPPQYVQPQQYEQPQQLAPDPNVPIHFMQALHTLGLRGGQARKNEGDSHCPSCGSQNVFMMSNGGAIQNSGNGNLVAPSSRCFECGWRPNGVVQGEQANWAS
jgi:hypothetical protein